MNFLGFQSPTISSPLGLKSPKTNQFLFISRLNFVSNFIQFRTTLLWKCYMRNKEKFIWPKSYKSSWILFDKTNRPDLPRQSLYSSFHLHDVRAWINQTRFFISQLINCLLCLKWNLINRKEEIFWNIHTTDKERIILLYYIKTSCEARLKPVSCHPPPGLCSVY